MDHILSVPSLEEGMNQKAGFKNMPKRQVKKFTKLKIKNAQQQVRQQTTRLLGGRPTDVRS